MNSKFVLLAGVIFTCSRVASANWADDYATWMQLPERYSEQTAWRPLLATAKAGDALVVADFALADARAGKAGALTVSVNALWWRLRDSPFSEQLTTLERLRQLAAEFGDSPEVHVIREVESMQLADLLDGIRFEEIPAERIAFAEIPAETVGTEPATARTIDAADVSSETVADESVAAQVIDTLDTKKSQENITHGSLAPATTVPCRNVEKKRSDVAVAIYSLLMRDADASLRDGRLLDARSRYSRALSLETEDRILSPAAYGIVRTFQEVNKLNLKGCREWASVNLKSPTQCMRVDVALGELYYRNQDYDLAIECLSRVSGDQSPAGQSAMLVLALCQHGKGAKADSLATLESVERNHVSEEVGAKALFLMGWIHLQNGEYDWARVIFNELPKRYPTSQFAAKAVELSGRLASHR